MSREAPLASAAQINARFVMLFEPGGRILPRTGLVAVGIVIEEGQEAEGMKMSCLEFEIARLKWCFLKAER